MNSETTLCVCKHSFINHNPEDGHSCYHGADVAQVCPCRKFEEAPKPERIYLDVEACPTCSRTGEIFGLRLANSQVLENSDWTKDYAEVFGEVETRYRSKQGHHVHFMRKESEK